MKEIVLFFTLIACSTFAIFLIAALIYGVGYLLLDLIKCIYNHFFIKTKPKVWNRNDLVCCVNEQLNLLKFKYYLHILMYLLLALIPTLVALTCIYRQNDITGNIAETATKIYVSPINTVQLEAQSYIPLTSYVSSAIFIIVVIATTIFIVNRILNVVKKLNNINIVKLKIISHIKIYNRTNDTNDSIDTNKILIEINRLTQELNVDSSRDIWRSIINSH